MTVLFAACAGQPGTRYKTDGKVADAVNPAPTTLSTPEPGGVSNINTTGAATRTSVVLPEGVTLDSLTGGSTSQEVVGPAITGVTNAPVIVRSAGKLNVRVDKLYRDGLPVLEGLTVEMDQTDLQRAVNEGFQALFRYATERDRALVERDIEALRTGKAVSSDLAGLLMPTLEKLIGKP